MARAKRIARQSKSHSKSTNLLNPKQKRKSRNETSGSGTPKKRNQLKHLQEIRYLQRTVHTLIPKAPFSRLVRDILKDEVSKTTYLSRLQPAEVRVTKEFLECLQEASEIFLTTFFEDINFLATHAHRVTVMMRDIQTLRNMKKLQ